MSQISRALLRTVPIATVAIALLGAAAVVVPAYAGPTFERGGFAINGYDPVAYFVVGQPVAGSADYSVKHAGATYLFSSAANRDRFVAEPERFAPQFGGFCAYGVSGGYKAKTDPQAFTVVNNRLYLNYNLKVQEQWRADREALVQKAERLWPEVAKTEKVH
jgi:YHS domain-containing protein